MPREPVLDVLAEWSEDLEEQRSRAAGQFGPIVLSHYPSLAVDPDLVAADLRSGAVLTGRATGNRFTLIGRGYTVELINRPGAKERKPMAVIAQVRETERMLPIAGWFRAEFELRLVYAEALCDLRELWTVLGANGPTRRTSDKGAGLRPYAQLLARRYGALRELQQLLKTRAEHNVVTARCTVRETLPGRPARLLVRVHGRAAEFEDAQVSAEAGDLRWETKVTDVHGDTAVIDAPATETPAELTLSKTSRFTMSQNVLALRSLMNGDTHGEWARLAALMVQSDSLEAAPKRRPEQFFADAEGLSLNPEQCAAVSGAISTPHVFCVQGPPGTGKTSVICEIIRQLVSRGERVLLLAPSHVAVDEALRRVGDKPGVRALRLSWSEGKVDEDLRRFLPDRLSAQIKVGVRRAASSRAAAWSAESAQIERYLTAIQVAAEGEQLVRSLESNIEAAEAELVAADGRMRTLISAHTPNVTRLRELQEEQAEESARAPETQVALQTQIAEAREALKDFEPALGRLRGIARSAELVRDRLTRARADKMTADREDVEMSNRLAPFDGRIAVTRDRIAEVNANLAHAKYWADAFRAQLDQIRPRGVADFFKQPDPRVADLKMRLKNAERSWTVWHDKLIPLQHELARHEHARAYYLPAQLRAEARAKEIGAFIDATTGHLNRLAEQWRAGVAGIGGDPASRLDGAVIIPTIEALRNGPPPLEWMAGSGPDRLVRSIRKAQARLTDLDNLPALQSRIAAELERAEAEIRERSQEHRTLIGRITQRLVDMRERLAWQQTVVEEAAQLLAEGPDLHADELRNRQVLLPYLEKLERRWCELTGELTDDQIGDGIDAAYTRWANLICATTAGIAGRGSDVVRDADFDTMILDEASRVTDTEFLIGAVRARRWVLVGDEKQLPPHVDNEDERFLHALVALDRWERDQAATLEESVRHLAAVWQDEEELRRVRIDDVVEYARSLHGSGQWAELYRKTFRSARRAAKNTLGGATDDDTDRLVLRNVRDFFVRSLFERSVARYPHLTEPLVTQRRMVDPIARLVRDSVYGGAYASPSAEDLAERGVRPLTTSTFSAPVVFLDTSAQGDAAMSEQVSTGFVNRLEAQWIVRACLEYEIHLRRSDPHGPRTTVSVLCFYKAQADLIWRELGGPGYRRFRRLEIKLVSSIDRSQGQESDLVLVSFTRAVPNAGSGSALWLQDLRRINVACTRAHRALVLVGHRKSLRSLGATGARTFYQGLFELIDSSSADYQLIKDLT
ncbi:DEAD/DEAH box helicase [Nonomuraea typhae]|uniref:DEAD/DEAH box helicase n=1 Tax=Nonomuraea typhae TaxID=2603600 RepID=UPI0012FB9FB0|nr:AAA domain-containing protein [Nonomuraea typhae]